MAQACDRIVNNLRQRGFLIDVVHFGPHRSIKVVQQQNGRLINIPDGEGPGHTLNCLYNLLRSPEYPTEYALIVAFGGYLPLVALPIFTAWFNTRSALLLRGNDFDLGIFSPGRRHLLFDAFSAADRVCVLSTEVEEKIMPFIDPEKVERIANGIDLANWTTDPSDQKSAEAWRKKNVGAEHKVIGLIGQFKAKKGGTFFLGNVLAANLHDKFHFLLIGDVAEPMQAWLEEHRDKLHFTQLPFLDHFELLRYYPACDFIALPSFYDGMPNVMLEAGALGIPLIAARVGGISDVVANLPEQADLLFHPGDRHGCRAALWNADQMTPERHRQVSKALRQHIVEHFDSGIETEAYVQLLQKLAKKSDIGFMKA
jgi:glycosyltransferase involved in cell wall biosynthesis